MNASIVISCSRPSISVMLDLVPQAERVPICEADDHIVKKNAWKGNDDYGCVVLCEEIRRSRK